MLTVKIIYGTLFLTNLVVFVVALVKKRMWLASLSFLVYISMSSFCTAVRISVGLPDSYLVEGPKSLYPVLLVMCISLVAGVITIFLRNRDNPRPGQDPSGRRWLHLSAGLLVGWGGYIYFLTTVYCPQVIGSETPMIKNGITVDFVATCIGVPILYFTSKLNSPQRPNLLRWLVFFIAVFFANCVLSSSFILIWAVPVQPLTTYPYWAALVTIVTIPYCLLILGLAKDFVPPKVNNVGDTASPPPPL